MAFSIEIADRISFGNLKLLILNVTDAQSAGSTYDTGHKRAHAVKAVNNTDSSDTFKESVGADSSKSTRGQVTFTPVTNNDDGLAFVWMR